MKNQKLPTFAFIHAAGVLIYVTLIAVFFRNANKLFGKEDTFATPIAMLMLFVVSATITGSLVLGKPIMLYLDGAKKEAVKMLFYTVGWLTVMTLIVFITLFLLK